MKPSRFPLFVWLGALPFFVAHIWLTAGHLPPKIATHFNEAGQADGWMSRDAHILSFIGLGLGMSVFISGLCYGIRWFPKARLGIPNQAHWQKPANRPFALDHIFHQSFWLGTLALVYLATVNHFVVTANQSEAAGFAARILQIATVGFIAGIILWIFLLVRFFQKPKLD